MVCSVLFPLILASCYGKHLYTREVAALPSGLSGTFSVLEFGCRHPDDIFNIAILDADNDPHKFEIYAPDFEFKTKNFLPADEAFKQAEDFIRCSFHFQQEQVSEIINSTGKIMGYEVRPLYSPLRFGMSDVMIVNYSKKDGIVRVYLRLDPRVEAIINNDRDERDNTQ